ncbi:hypothetical protein [Mesorhizobium sp. SEMIA 3007]|uniref:hypothetical protein n=1 Tax=Mesorhizobium sp. SEMIA 3007 TaxID=1862350 RepID=UPI001495DDBE|nr:hypothetical protein [Mesorhizobium sp. SEMIA 3007]
MTKQFASLPFTSISPISLRLRVATDPSKKFMESLRPPIAVNGTLTTTFEFSGGRNLASFYVAAEQHLRRARNDKASRTSMQSIYGLLKNDDTGQPPAGGSAS